MDRRPTRPPLSVEEAKARVRLAAAQAEPAVMIKNTIQKNPWSALAVMVVAGLVIGASPTLRRALGSVVLTGLQAVRPR